MKIKTFCTLVAVVLLQQLNAQDTLRQERVVSLNLTSYLVTQSPRWTAGYTHKVSRRWWAGVEAGYGSFWLSVHGRESDFLTKDYNLFEIRPSVYFDLRPTSKIKHLLSAELFYIHHTDHFVSEWYHDKSESVYYQYDSADFKRVKTGVNLNLNTIYYLGKKLVLWQQIGVGIRNRKVTYNNMVNRQVSQRFNDGEDHFDLFGFDNQIQQEGSYFGFNANLALKMAYIF